MKIYLNSVLLRNGTVAIILFSLMALAAAARQASSEQWQRLNDGSPILAPQGDGFESAGVFNPAVIKKDGRFVMLYRAQDKSGTSRLGFAESTDGIHFTRRAQPVLAPEAAYEKDGGVEDPRLVKIGGTYYLTYTGYNTREAQLCLATSKDLVHWQRRGVIMPANRGRWNVGWTKSGAILTVKVNGRYWMYYMADPAKDVNEMGVAYSTALILGTEPLHQPVLRRRPGRFDAKVVEPGPPPLMTKAGILLI